MTRIIIRQSFEFPAKMLFKLKFVLTLSVLLYVTDSLAQETCYEYGECTDALYIDFSIQATPEDCSTNCDRYALLNVY